MQRRTNCPPPVSPHFIAPNSFYDTYLRNSVPR